MSRGTEANAGEPFVIERTCIIECARTRRSQRGRCKNGSSSIFGATPCRAPGPGLRVSELIVFQVAKHLQSDLLERVDRPTRQQTAFVTSEGAGLPSRTASMLSMASMPIAKRVSTVALPMCGNRNVFLECNIHPG